MTHIPHNRLTTPPLNPPDMPVEEKRRALAGIRPPDEQAAYIDHSDTDTLAPITPTDLYEGELPAGPAAETGEIALLDDVDEALIRTEASLDLLTELDLRAEETDDPLVAAEEAYTYVPPIDPPIVPGRAGTRDNAVIASGLGVSALDEPYDESHHSSLVPDDDEMSARVREALRADSSTSAYADQIEIETRNGVVTLRGVVDDLIDNDNLLAVAAYVTGVQEVVDALRVRALE